MSDAATGLAAHWPLDPAVTFLNHGSFGSCPRAVLAEQQAWRDRLERQPVDFLVRELEPLLDAARAALAAFVGADADDLVPVPNATAGVNTVLRALEFTPGDELLVTDHAYNACANALRYVAERSGARVVVARLPFPLAAADEVLEAVLAATTPRTRLALIDHVTSPTALVLPIAAIVRELSARGIDTLVDGAHAPGMVAVDIDAIGAAYYTGNCHKWLCAPKGAAFLHVRRDRQHAIRPLVISHGANSPRRDRSRLQLEFGWTGTADPSAFLSVPAALRCMDALLPGGWPALMARNHALAVQARDILGAALGTAAPCPPAMLGAMATVGLPPQPAASVFDPDPLQQRLRREFAIEVPVFSWPAPPTRWLRISAQAYNTESQYHALAAALP